MKDLLDSCVGDPAKTATVAKDVPGAIFTDYGFNTTRGACCALLGIPRAPQTEDCDGLEVGFIIRVKYREMCDPDPNCKSASHFWGLGCGCG
jgi:hypothetical protein